MHPNKLISWFMIASYAYYHLDTQVMSDYDFDFLAIRIKNSWESIDHPHKSLIKKTNLDSSTGYDINYPTIVKGATVDFLNKNNIIF
jgi:hypothetical protein